MAATDDAIRKLREMIATGAFTPGQRLPPEQELSTLLGLSRGSMREAIKALEVLNILDVRRGDGTYVTSLEPRLLMETISFVADLHTTLAVDELREVKRIVEAAAVGEAAHRAQPHEVQQLRSSMAATSASDGEQEASTDSTGGFHQKLVDLAGNSYLSTIYASVDGIAARRSEIDVLEACSPDSAEHVAIIQAVADGDGVLAQSLVLAHAFKQEPQREPAPAHPTAPAQPGTGPSSEVQG